MRGVPQGMTLSSTRSAGRPRQVPGVQSLRQPRVCAGLRAESTWTFLQGGQRLSHPLFPSPRCGS